jgi:glycerol-3-phosphate dehydrogenase (NAD(P)+)
MAKILILGAGAMGTAFAYPCSDNKHDVNIVGTHLEDKAIEELNKNYFHSGLNLEVIKSIKFFKHECINDIIKDKIDLIVIGVSSKGIDWVAEELKKISKNRELPNLLMLTKGLSVNGSQYELLVDKLERLLSEKGVKNINLSAVGGPCLASGLANRVHSGVVIANKNLDSAKSISKMLATNYYHISTSSDINGVEVCAAIKNIFSMVIGAASGLNKTKPQGNLYLNTSATLMKQSVYEMEIFAEFLKGKKETVKGLAGLGDLYVSAAGGRNSKMGALIGEGMIFSEAKKNKMANVTVEGSELIFEIGRKVKEDFDDKTLPLMIAMINAIIEDKKLDIKWENFN